VMPPVTVWFFQSGTHLPWPGPPNGAMLNVTRQFSHA
jgi:hypothetical protein